jgi:hypothetical protein
MQAQRQLSFHCKAKDGLVEMHGSQKSLRKVRLYALYIALLLQLTYFKLLTGKQ